LAADIGKSALSGLSAGAAGLAGTPHDLPKLADYGLAWAGAHINEALGGEKAQDALERSHGSILRAAVGDKGYDALTQFSLPGAEYYQGQAEKFLPVLGYKPQSAAGRYAHEIAAFAPGALIPFGEAGLASRLASTVAPAVGSETLGHMAEGTYLEPWARLAGAGLGSLAHTGVESYTRPITTGGQQATAAAEAKQAASDPGAALAKLRAEQAQSQPGMATGENVPGSRPTPAQITGDYGQVSAEGAFQRENEALHGQRMAEQSAAQTGAVRGVQDTGNPQTVADLITKHLQDIDAAHELAVGTRQQAHDLETQRLTQEAQAATGQVARKGESEALGEAARKPLAESMAKAKEREQALWRAIQADRIGVWTNQVRAQARNIAKRMGQMQKPMEGDEARIFGNAADALPRWTKLSDLTDLRSDLTTAMRKERFTNGSTPAVKRMTQLLKTVDNVIKNAATRQSAREAATEMENLRRMTPQDQAAIMKARAATKARGDIERSPAGAIVRQGATSGTYRTLASQVPGKVFAAGPTGGQKLKAYTTAGGAMDPVHDIVADSLAREATTDGMVDAKKLQAWQGKYREALNALPDEIRQRFVGGPTQAGQALAEGAAARREALIAHSKLDVAKQMGKESPEAQAMRKNPAFKGFEGADNPVHVQRAVAGLFQRPDGVTRMGELARFLAGSSAAEGLKRAALDHVLEKTLSGAEAGTTGELMLKPATFQKAVAKDKAMLKAAGFDDAQLQTLDKVAADIQRQARFNANKVRAGSNTGQNLAKVIKKAGESAHHGSGWLAPLIAIKEAREMLPESLHGVAGLAGAAVAGTGALALKHFRNSGLRKAQDIYHEAIMDPDKMADLLSQRTPNLRRTAARHAMYAGLAAERHEALGPRGRDIYVNKSGAPSVRSRTAQSAP
jgi:hypothetical protein